MEKKRILVVDDEQDLCDILLFNLQNACYEAEAVGSAEEALARDVAYFDLLILDVMMPGMSGFELANVLKADKTTAHIPIIFLTAKDTEDDTLQGFSLGADDYVSKPFSVRELMARIKAVLGRISSNADNDIICFEKLVIEPSRLSVSVDGRNVMLTKTEFELLMLLVENRGIVFSRQDVLDRVWPKNVVVTDRTVDVNIARLRKKIGRYSACIVSRQGHGYIFDETQLDDNGTQI